MSEAELKGGTDISVCRPFLAGGRVLVPRGASARVPTVPGCHASKVIVLWLSPLPCYHGALIVSPLMSGMMRSTAQTRRAMERSFGIACLVPQSAGICLPGMCAMRTVFSLWEVVVAY